MPHSVNLEASLRRLALCETSAGSPRTQMVVSTMCELFLLFLGDAPSTCARRLDEQGVALAHEYGGLPAYVDLPRLEWLALVIVLWKVSVLLPRLLHPSVAPKGTGSTALHAIWLARTTFREYRHLQGLEKLDLANYTVATTPSALATGSLPDAELVDDDGVTAFKNLDIADTCVGDVSMHTGRAVPARPSA